MVMVPMKGMLMLAAADNVSSGKYLGYRESVVAPVTAGGIGIQRNRGRTDGERDGVVQDTAVATHAELARRTVKAGCILKYADETAGRVIAAGATHGTGQRTACTAAAARDPPNKPRPMFTTGRL